VRRSVPLRVPERRPRQVFRRGFPRLIREMRVEVRSAACCASESMRPCSRSTRTGRTSLSVLRATLYCPKGAASVDCSHRFQPLIGRACGAWRSFHRVLSPTETHGIFRARGTPRNCCAAPEISLRSVQALPVAGRNRPTADLRRRFLTESPGVHETHPKASRPSTLWSGLTPRLSPRGVVRAPGRPRWSHKTGGLSVRYP
jgi:hypothetical protein